MYLALTLSSAFSTRKAELRRLIKKSEQFYTATTNCIEVRNGAGYLANSDAA